jgi:iron complex outermembrane recepter protein
MVRFSSLALAICLCIGGIAPAAADGDRVAPGSLRMRPRSHPGVRPQASQGTQRPARGKQLAQSPPADGPADHGTPAGDPAADAPASEPAPLPSLHPGHPAPPAPPEPPAAPSPELSESDFARLAEQDFKEEVIVVTGSTIGRKTLTTSAPLTIIDREMLTAAGSATIGDILQLLPAQQNGINAQINVGSDGGATRIDVRGLTSGRTLTLINGRRVVPSGTGANVSVDLNTIPLAIVERVEILKDGASAIYGSDAIGGVVNIITRTDFDRSEAMLYTGGTQRGDGFGYEASFVTGHTADSKKGNILFAAGVHRQDPVFAGDRSFSRNDLTYDYANRTVIPGGSTAVPGGRINTRTIDMDGDGRPDNVDLCGAGVQFCTSNGAGGYRPFVAPDDLYNAQPPSYLYTPSSRYYLFTAGSYKLGSHASTFFEGSFANRKSAQQLAADQFINSVPISRDSMYNALGGTVLGYQRRLDEVGPRRAEQNINTFRIVGGLKGSMPEEAGPLKRFKWELSYNYGRNEGEQVNTGNLIRSRLAAAVGPSFMNASGVPTCGTPTRPIAGCVPINVLGAAGSIDADSIAYVTFTGVRNGFNQQQTVLAETHGQIAKLPNNGDLSLAIGGDFRAESGATTPDPLAATGDTTGTSVAPTKGSYSVAEGFAELSLVPVSGKPLAEWLELNLAARAFRYNTFGSGVTWKTGALYRPISGFALRSTYSTSFRAPSVTELYQGRTDSLFPVIDPCDTRPLGTPIALDPEVAAECANRGVPMNAAFGSTFSRTQASGNPNLKPETARVLTAGFVVEPPQAKGLAVTFDYFHTTISKTIQQLGANVILANCYLRHDEAACQQVHRNPLLGGAIDFIEIPTKNVGGVEGSGIDFAVAFDRKLGAAGRFRQQLESQYLLKAKIDNSFQIINAVNNNDLGARPRIRANFSSLWQHPLGMGGGFNVRYIGTFKECEQNNCNAGMPSRDVDAYYKVDLFGSYTMSSRAGTTAVTLGVNNLLDRNPPSIYGSVFGDYDPTAYDFKGRSFYARLSQQF